MSASNLLPLLVGKLNNLRHRSPVYIAVRAREEAREWNAFVIGVDYGKFKAAAGEPTQLRGKQ